MVDYVTLVGAEAVQRAANTMLSAAETMNRASENLDDALHRHRLFMDDWLQRLEAVIGAKEDKP